MSSQFHFLRCAGKYLGNLNEKGVLGTLKLEMRISPLSDLSVPSGLSMLYFWAYGDQF